MNLEIKLEKEVEYDIINNVYKNEAEGLTDNSPYRSSLMNSPASN